MASSIQRFPQPPSDGVSPFAPLSSVLEELRELNEIIGLLNRALGPLVAEAEEERRQRISALIDEIKGIERGAMDTKNRIEAANIAQRDLRLQGVVQSELHSVVAAYARDVRKSVGSDITLLSLEQLEHFRRDIDPHRYKMNELHVRQSPASS